MEKLLYLVEKTHPILREVMPEVLDFNDPALHEDIKNMCYSILPEQLKRAKAAYESAAGMAANQWGIRRRLFIFTPDGTTTENQSTVIINPSYTPLQGTETEPTLEDAFEGCFSIPLTTGIVSRYQTIKANYQTPSGDKIECILEGWKARVFQHETDHLNGKLFDGLLDNYSGPLCSDRVLFKDNDEMDSFWEKKVRPARKSPNGS
jgi:peptide deformylase